MKQLTRIRLINWHLFENTTITCQGTTYFIGINGAGKSTVLDAVQFALVGGQRDTRFNQAALSGGKRTLASYVRCELGIEGQRYLRGDTTGVVALEFRNPDGTHFVHGGVIDAYEDGRSPDVSYFVVHNAMLNDDWFFKSGGQIFDSRAFKRHLEHFSLPAESRAQVFTRLEDYRFHLLNRLGQLKDSFLAKIVKGVAFSPLTNIRSFVHNYLLDENLVDVKTLQAQLETLRHFESLAADVRERIASLEQIDEFDQERLANRRRRITNGYIRRRAQGDDHLAELKTRRIQLDEAQLELSRAEVQRDEMTENLRFAQNDLFDARVTLETDHTAAREKELNAEIATLEPELAKLQERAAEISQTIAREQEDAGRLRELLEADGTSIPPEVDQFIQAQNEENLEGEYPHLKLVRALQTPLSTLGSDFASQRTLLDEKVRQNQDETARLEREISQLRTGDRQASYEAESPSAVRLQRLLRAQLELSQDDVQLLCTTLQIPDESWQDAVEGILGRARFTLMVPPEHYDEAVRIYRQHRHKDGVHGVGLLDTERLLQNKKKSKKNSLATEVQTDHPAARAFVDLLLGDYVKVKDIEELRGHPTAVTGECFVRRNFATHHLNPRTYRRWFIGERSGPRQIEQRQERLDEITVEMGAIIDKSTAFQERSSLTQDKIRTLVELEHALPALAQLTELEARLGECQRELASLDTQTVTKLQANLERCQAETNRLHTENSTHERQIGGFQAKIQNLADEILPGLEQTADQAIQDAGQFIAQEINPEQSLEDTLAEVDKEYTRRRERQPIETILQNATRYENDYANAEMRSRDRLREAKQAYSLRYDFGYDDAEDAARYLTEREKLVGSELPQYETRIAEQRALAEQELVENFIHRLREQVMEARQQLSYLNTTLSQLRFGGERFEFTTRPSPSLRQVYDMVMDSQRILGDSLFESDFRQRHQQGWDLLFERLTGCGPEGDEALTKEIRELQDYRNYLEYDIRIHYPKGARALLSKINTKKSGGETTTPFYVAMAASFAQAYRLNQSHPSDTIRLAMFDEAFGKMDTARTASALKFMNDTGLQVLLATPPDKSAALLDYVDSVRTVVRKNNHAFVIEIDKAEMVRELEAASVQ
ncbi:MAG: AAA family ATPase [Anaerolineales bacterium]|nr:AAA family ATPase [Chloroflexota bacterium]MBL6981347.1 AAA family ATPase [Anaerolineales bacterium]